MKNKTELPTESGLYWWRESTSNEWSAIEVQKYDDGTSFYPIGRYIKWFGRTLTVWKDRHPVGFWSRIPTPDEPECDPVRVAADALLENMEHVYVDDRKYLNALHDALEATK